MILQLAHWSPFLREYSSITLAEPSNANHIQISNFDEDF